MVKARTHGLHRQEISHAFSWLKFNPSSGLRYKFCLVQKKSNKLEVVISFKLKVNVNISHSCMESLQLTFKSRSFHFLGRLQTITFSWPPGTPRRAGGIDGRGRGVDNAAFKSNPNCARVMKARRQFWQLVKQFHAFMRTFGSCLHQYFYGPSLFIPCLRFARL